jgi:hypothetical protein
MMFIDSKEKDAWLSSTHSQWEEAVREAENDIGKVREIN